MVDDIIFTAFRKYGSVLGLKNEDLGINDPYFVIIKSPYFFFEFDCYDTDVNNYIYSAVIHDGFYCCDHAPKSVQISYTTLYSWAIKMHEYITAQQRPYPEIFETIRFGFISGYNITLDELLQKITPAIPVFESDMPRLIVEEENGFDSADEDIE